MGSQSAAVLVVTPAGSKMARSDKVLLVLLVSVQCILGARQLRNPAAARRDGKSLVGTFPFNANTEDHHHGHHEEHHEKTPSQSVAGRAQRQGGEGADVSFGAVAGAGPGADGKRCIDKVEMVEETEYGDVVQCDHSYDKRCHTTYVTNYESQQEEDCEENFRKNCFIEYETIAFNETAQICRTPLVKDCDVQGPEICKTEIEEKCEDETSGYTTNTKCSKWPKEVCSVSKKNVKKYTPITGCTKEPRELCAPAGCGFKQGSEECYDKTQTVVQD